MIEHVIIKSHGVVLFQMPLHVGGVTDSLSYCNKTCFWLLGDDDNYALSVNFHSTSTLAWKFMLCRAVLKDSKSVSISVLQL